jgi:hypothetical protein
VTRKAIATLGHLMGPENAHRYIIHKCSGNLAHAGDAILQMVLDAVGKYLCFKRVNVVAVDREMTAGTFV